MSKSGPIREVQPTSQKARLTTSGETIQKENQPLKTTQSHFDFALDDKSSTSWLQNVWKIQQTIKKMETVPYKDPGPHRPQGEPQRTLFDGLLAGMCFPWCRSDHVGIFPLKNSNSQKSRYSWGGSAI